MGNYFLDRLYEACMRLQTPDSRHQTPDFLLNKVKVKNVT